MTNHLKHIFDVYKSKYALKNGTGELTFQERIIVYEMRIKNH